MRLFRDWSQVGFLIAVGVAASAFQAQADTRVFVTSTAPANGNLGGLAGADAFCNGLASTAGLGGNWVAWLSTSTVNAVSRLSPGQGAIKKVNGVTVAANIADLTDGTLFNAIDTDENGSSSSALVWTGTAANGTQIGPNCQNWTSNGLGDLGRFGVAQLTDGRWTNDTFTGGNDGCFVPNSYRLYCFEVFLSPVPAVGEWGLIAMALMLLTLAYFGLGRRFESGAT